VATEVIDPRIPAPARPAALAPRRRGLSGARVLLFDNGKLGADYGPYRAIFDVVEAALGDAAEVRHHTDDLLRGTGARLAEVARWVRDQDVTGVVLALGDWGVSQPTAIVAAELERLGVPTSLVTTGIGGRQALAAARRMAPGLPVTTLRALRSATSGEVAAEVKEVLDDILDGLTADPATLHQRFAAHPVASPAPAEPGGLLTLTGDDPSAEFTARMRESLLGDGLPLVAPTTARVAEFLGERDPEAEVWPAIPPRDTPVTAREVAAVAVAAGCRPRWAPVVFAAYEAMADPGFRLFQAAITTHPGGTLVFVSGPDAESYGFASGRGALGPGFEANATTGRAVALGYSFLLGAVPGGADLTAQGSPAEYTYCCAENLAESPWPGLHADLGHPDATTVTVLKCEGPHNILDQQSAEPGRLLGTFASSMATLGSNAAYVAGAETLLLLNPEHARLLAAAGWSRRDVREFLFDAARNPRADLRGRGLAPIWPAWFDAAERVPVVPDAASLLVAIAGGAGPASQVAIPWGYSRAVTRPVQSTQYSPQRRAK
jgi:hypothetical protein